MTIGNRYQSLSVEDAITAAELNRDTMKAHLDQCRPEINALNEKLRRAERECHEFLAERDELKQKLASFHDLINDVIVDLPGDRCATVEDILSNPSRYGHRRCEVPGHSIDCEGRHAR